MGTALRGIVYIYIYMGVIRGLYHVYVKALLYGGSAAASRGPKDYRCGIGCLAWSIWYIYIW